MAFDHLAIVTTGVSSLSSLDAVLRVGPQIASPRKRITDPGISLLQSLEQLIEPSQSPARGLGVAGGSNAARGKQIPGFPKPYRGPLESVLFMG
jgi:hypothetical protein